MQIPIVLACESIPQALQGLGLKEVCIPTYIRYIYLLYRYICLLNELLREHAGAAGAGPQGGVDIDAYTDIYTYYTDIYSIPQALQGLGLK
jgi:hypothetical protein